ncbi:hypothetical protein vseg_014228 [Gypsophila vaccaria]
MEFFKRAEVFRLKAGHNDKYLVVNQDEQTVAQSSSLTADSTTGYWSIETVEGKSNVVRLKSCNSWKYLAAIDKSFLLGMTGKKVVQRLRLDKTVEWEPIKEGSYVKFKSHCGTFLRANRGPPPWRNSVTHDLHHHWTVKENMVLWIVDVVKMADHFSPESTAIHGSDDQQSQDSESFGKLKSMLSALESHCSDSEENQNEESLEGNFNGRGGDQDEESVK